VPQLVAYIDKGNLDAAPSPSGEGLEMTTPHHNMDRERIERERKHLNHPWELHNFSQFDSNPTLLRQALKVFIMGKYKVGKTNLLRLMGVRNATPSSLKNTRGEVFLTDPSSEHKNTIYVDTEGFGQPINTSEPELRKHLILRHATLCADAVILVFPQLMIDDLQMFVRLLKGFQRHTGGPQLLVVHNLPMMISLNELREYMDVIERNLFGALTKGEARDRPQDGILRSSYAVSEETKIDVFHYFLGNQEDLPIYNSGLIKHIKSRLVTAHHREKHLVDSFVASLEGVSLQAYSFEDSLVQAPEYKTYFKSAQPSKLCVLSSQRVDNKSDKTSRQELTSYILVDS